MSATRLFPANLELRETNDEGTAIAGLSHKPGGMFLLFVQEVASKGEPRGAFTFVHDAGDHGARYEELAYALADDGWAVSLPDMRGHGRSEGERGHSGGIEEVVRDLGEVQSHLAYMAPQASRVLAGQGLGALWALAAACEQPAGLVGLVLANPLLEPRFSLPQRKGGLAKLFSRVGPRSVGDTGFEAASISSDESAARAWSADPLVHRKISLRAGEQARLAAERFLPRLATLGIPVLLLQGGADPLGSPERAKQLAVGSVELRLFEGLRHDLFHEPRSAEVIQVLRTWLAGL